MSRFLLLASSNEATGLAIRLQAEGHDVRLWTRETDAKDAGKGLVNLVDGYRYCNTVVDTDNNYGAVVDMLRDCGGFGFAGGNFHERLEEDREFAESVMAEAGIDTPESIRAESWEEASLAVQKLSGETGKVVIKPEGELSGVLPSYVAPSEEDALEYLKTFEMKVGGAEPEIVIQEFVVGVAVSTEGWFNGHDWVEGMFNHTIEKKEMLNGDLGPSSGCAGNVVWECGRDPLVEASLLKLTKTLRKHRYIGPIDINCEVNDDTVYGLEFTPRFGYDAFPTLLYSLSDFDFGSFIYSVSRGDSPEVRLSEGFGAGIRLTIPKDSEEQYKIKGLSEGDLKWFYPYAVQLDEDDDIKTVKKGYDLGVMNGHGDSIDEAFDRAYRRCKKLSLRGLSYRTDLAEVLLKDFRKLQRIFEGALV